jgi:hypothetical protein
MRAISKVIGVAMLMVLGTALQAHALAITPSTGTLNVTRWVGNQNGQDQIDAAIAPIIGTSTELYKQDVGAGSDSGALAGSYSTVFLNTAADPSGATITHVSGPVVGPTAYLLVKDGNQEPAWYLFNLTALSWTGTQTLDLSGFWPNQGAISHVALYGTRTQVPDGGMTISLLGSALVGLGLLRRKLNA